MTTQVKIACINRYEISKKPGRLTSPRPTVGHSVAELARYEDREFLSW